MTEPLTAEQVAALPEGTVIDVIWSGGNGPHRYKVHVERGQRFAGSLDDNPRMLTYNPLEYVGQKRFHTRVWLATPADESTSSPSTGPTSRDTATSPESIGPESSGSTFWPADSLASPRVALASSAPRMTNGGSGRSSIEPFARFDPISSSWRTSQTSWLSTEGQPSVTLSVIWPRSGMTRNGTAFQRRPLVPFTTVTEFGSWPTPHAGLAKHSGKAAYWERRIRDGRQRDLWMAVYQTDGPGPLNPKWVAWLMGFPPDWLDSSTHLATRSSRKSSKSSVGDSSK